MKLLLIVAAALEAVTGLALLLIPTVAVSALLWRAAGHSYRFGRGADCRSRPGCPGHRMLASKKRQTRRPGDGRR